MGADIGIVIILALTIFAALEFSLVIIPAFVSRSKVRTSAQPVFDVPVVLAHPVSQTYAAEMRSWYFDRHDLHSHIWDIPLEPDARVNYSTKGQEFPVFTERHAPVQHETAKDWTAINNANRAILRANKAVLESNRAILEVNTALQQAGDDDLI